MASSLSGIHLPPSSEDRVLVFIPVFNGTTTLEQSLVSIAGQSFTNLLVVVVDDGSTDGSSHMIANFVESRSLPWLIQRNTVRIGITSSLSRVLESARDLAFTHVLLFSQDDVAHRHHIASRMRMAHRCKAVLVTGPALITNEQDRLIAKVSVPPRLPKSAEWRSALMIWRNWVFGPGTLVQRNSLELALAPPELDPVQDWFQWCCMARAGEFAVDSSSCMIYKVRADSMSRTTGGKDYIDLTLELRMSVLHRFIRESRDGGLNRFDYVKFRRALCALLKLDPPSPERDHFLEAVINWSVESTGEVAVEGSLGVSFVRDRPRWEARNLPGWLVADWIQNQRILPYLSRLMVRAKTAKVRFLILKARLKACEVRTCRGPSQI